MLMKSLKNHLSLIIALFTVLVSVEIYVAVDRTISTYEAHLKNSYSIIVVTQSAITPENFKAMDSMIQRSETISTAHVLENLKGEITPQNLSLLGNALPKFYRIYLNRFPTPEQITALQHKLQKNPAIQRVEGFTQTHNAMYQLMLLFKRVFQLLSIAIATVTSLLIFKEMRLLQVQHTDRVAIMALLGAPALLRSAVLFRLAIVDALLATLLLSSTLWGLDYYAILAVQLKEIGISVQLFSLMEDTLRSLAIALGITITFMFTIVVSHHEEK
jgi:cell division transport system permease protein